MSNEIQNDRKLFEKVANYQGFDQSAPAPIISFEEATRMVYGNRETAWRMKEMLGKLLATVDPNQAATISKGPQEPASKQLTMPQEIYEASREIDRTFSIIEETITQIAQHIKAQ